MIPRWMVFSTLAVANGAVLPVAGGSGLAVAVICMAVLVWRWERPGTMVDPMPAGLVGDVDADGIRGFGVSAGRVLAWRAVRRLRVGYLGGRLPMWVVVESGEEVAWLELRRQWGDLEGARLFLASVCPEVELEEAPCEGLVSPYYGAGSVTAVPFWLAVACGVGVMVLAWWGMKWPAPAVMAVSGLVFLGAISIDRASRVLAVGLLAQLAVRAWAAAG